MDDTPFFSRPMVRIWCGILAFLLVYGILTALQGDWQSHMFRMMGDALLVVLGTAFWLIFFTQFILPVRKLANRVRLLERIFIYYAPKFLTLGLVDLHGPAIFIKDGKIIQKAIKKGGQITAEIEKRGPGVIWLDSASAAVLRTPVRFTRAVGPGIVFTRGDETIAGVVDLHTQKHSLGPEENEDPFASKPDDLTDEAYKDLQDRIRWMTSGMTRDGIEVVAKISVTFKIDADEGKHEGNTYFGYNAEAVFKAIANESINPSFDKDSPHFRVAWNERPALIAADLWREYLRKFTLSQLFEFLPGAGPGQPKTGDETALQFIVRMINERLKQSQASVIDEVGRPTGQKQPSREFQLLKDSGIKMLKVSVKHLCFPPGIEEQLVRQWSAKWLETARWEREQVEQKRSLASLAGMEDALREFALQASRELAKHPTRQPKDALAMLLQDSLNGTKRNPSLYRRLDSEPRELSEMLQWLMENA